MKFEIPLLQYFQNNNEYSAALKGMRYFFSPQTEPLFGEDGAPILDEKGKAKTITKLHVTIWPDPWAMNRTDPALRTTNIYPFTEEGRAQATAWLGEMYEVEFDRWQNCPTIMDCNPWYPAPEPQEEKV